MIQGWRNYLGLLPNLPVSSSLPHWTQDKASNSFLSDLIPFPCRQGSWKAHSRICHFSGMMSWQLFTPRRQACHLTPLLCLGSSVWWAALSDRQPLKQPLLSSWLFQPSWLLHQAPTLPAIGTSFKCLCWFLAYPREKDIIKHHSQAVWELAEGTGSDTPKATRPPSCHLRQWLWGQPEESRQIHSKNYFNPVKKMKWQENMSLGVWLRTSPQEHNWPEMMCTCFRPDSSSLCWALTNPRGCILHREISASFLFWVESRTLLSGEKQ